MVTGYPGEVFLFGNSKKIFSFLSDFILKDIFPVIFLIRLVYLILTVKPKYSYYKLLTDSLLLGVGLFIFKDFMNFIIKVPDFAKNMVESLPQQTIDLNQVDNSDSAKLQLFGFSLYGLDETVSGLSKKISLLAYGAMYWIHVFLLSIMTALGGIFIFFGTFLNMSWALSLFLMTGVILSLWPFVWYILEYVSASFIATQASNMHTIIYLSVVIALSLFKIIAPISAFKYGLKSPLDFSSQGFNIAVSGARSVYQGVESAYQNTRQGYEKVKENYTNQKNDQTSFSRDSSINQGIEPSYNDPLLTSNQSNSSWVRPGFSNAQLAGKSAQTVDFTNKRTKKLPNGNQISVSPGIRQNRKTGKVEQVIYRKSSQNSNLSVSHVAMTNKKSGEIAFHRVTDIQALSPVAQKSFYKEHRVSDYRFKSNEISKDHMNKALNIALTQESSV